MAATDMTDVYQHSRATLPGCLFGPTSAVQVTLPGAAARTATGQRQRLKVAACGSVRHARRWVRSISATTGPSTPTHQVAAKLLLPATSRLCRTLVISVSSLHTQLFIVDMVATHTWLLLAACTAAE